MSTSLSLYLGPIVSAVLSILFLGEAPTVIHLIGGALSLGGMWLSLQAKQSGLTPCLEIGLGQSVPLTIIISYIIRRLYN